MKAIMLMFDSLNRHMLPPYGCDWTHAPNFKRLAEKTAIFDRCYVGSMPCMPARRELHTGRYNFLHRGWGPLEPFDDSMPQILSRNGVYTHLDSDHYHYWEDGGATYHNRYNSWQFFRGQEGDPFVGQVAEPPMPAAMGKMGPHWRHDWVNRQFMRREEDQPQPKTFAAGMDFIRRNHSEDRWFLHIETFDPHEPFFTQQKYKDLYKHDYDGPHFDWPPYRFVNETPEQVHHVRMEYAALLSMCDEYLGRLLDLMDELDLWQDTMLIVNTDHGFLLSEHECWAKCWAPMYEEVAHTPLFIWDPRAGVRGQRRSSLVQTIDLAPTLLDFFGVQPTPDMQGRPLLQTVIDDSPVRPAGIFGIFGGQVNVTDGRYVYMRAPVAADAPCHEYTFMPTRMRGMFAIDLLAQADMAPEPFSFTKGLRPMRVPRGPEWRSVAHPGRMQNLLFDVQEDPRQQRPLNDPAIEARMIDLLVEQMRQSDAPAEQFARIGVPAGREAARR